MNIHFMLCITQRKPHDWVQFWVLLNLETDLQSMVAQLCFFHGKDFAGLGVVAMLVASNVFATFVDNARISFLKGGQVLLELHRSTVFCQALQEY